MEIIKINESTWSIEDGFVRFFLLTGEEKAVMIDSGVSGLDALAIAKTLTDKPIILLNTHGDGDHIAATGSFKEIYIHKRDYVNCDIRAKYPSTVLAEIKDDDVVDLGSRPLKIIHIPGHTMGSVAILDVKNRVLYAGDSVQKGNIYMFGKHRSPELFDSSLDKLIAIKDQYDYIYASHGDLTLPADYTEKIKTAWNQVLSGDVGFKTVDLNGTKVKEYITEVCGFYAE